ncbi:MAG: bifunctional adenosylcobinamide kinase/adenosylcobinamide-phosphate guanylyltransferase [Dehalococcoidia bacterium]
MVSQLSLVLGGVRSGKSAFAEGLALELAQPTLYLATGQATDTEMAERIRRHRERRPSHWQTLEEPLDPADALSAALAVPHPPGVALLDSLDGWVSNLLLQHESADPDEVESLALGTIDRLLETCNSASAAFFLVSSEVGLSLVPPYPLGRRFQDLLGLVNQRVAAAADRVYLVVAGISVVVKGSQGK